jgi:hypothetical protein
VADRAARFGQDLETSLEALAKEAPAHFLAVERHLAGRSVTIAVGGAPPVRVQLQGAPPWVHPGAEGDVSVAIAQRDLDALVAGAITIEDALWSQRLSLRGRLDDVLAFMDGLTAWLHGALRAPSLSELHRAYVRDRLTD